MKTLASGDKFVTGTFWAGEFTQTASVLHAKDSNGAASESVRFPLDSSTSVNISTFSNVLLGIQFNNIQTQAFTASCETVTY